MSEEPISAERFTVLVEQAGLKLTPEQFEELRQGYRLSSGWSHGAAAARSSGRACAYLCPPERLRRRWTRPCLTVAEASVRIAGGQPPGGADRGVSRPHGALDGEPQPCSRPARRGCAAAARDIAAGRSRGALHGIPIGLKDIYKTRGIRTTAARGDTWIMSRTRMRKPGAAGATPARSCSASRRRTNSRSAGRISACPFLPARNPWNTAHYPAGSSSGSAVAVAAGPRPRPWI